MKSACAVLALVLPIWAEGQTRSQTDAVALLRDRLERDGRAASVGATNTIKYETTLQRAEGCRIVFRSTLQSDVSVDTIVASVDLAALAPEVAILPWADSSMFPVYAYSSNGDSIVDQESVTRFVSGGRVVRASSKVTNIGIQSDVMDAAERIRAQVRNAITACGGKPLSASAKRAIAESDKAATAQLDQLLGKDSLGIKLKGQCRALVSAQLAGPSTAIFSEESVIPEKDSSRTVMGSVEAMNRLGGRVKKMFMCTFEKYGNSWVTKGGSNIF